MELIASELAERVVTEFYGTNKKKEVNERVDPTLHKAPNLYLRQTYQHTRLLTPQTSFTVYPLPTKENKLKFSVSVGSKETELPFFVSSVFRIYMYTENVTSDVLYTDI